VPYPRLRLELSKPGGSPSFGSFDVFLPALTAHGNGTLDRWLAGPLPCSHELSRRISGEARRAAWADELVISGGGSALLALSRSLTGRDIAALSADYETLEAAVDLMGHAVFLRDRIAKAVFVEGMRPAIHPVGGGEGLTPDVPFGFAITEARWKGVKPRTLFDFALGSGSTDAQGYLATVIRNPSSWLRDIPALEGALLRLARDRDVAGYRADVAAWNMKQSVVLRVPDHSVAVSPDAGRTEASDWCETFLASTRELVRALVEEHWGWCPDQATPGVV
jgi:hypothetical protein